MKDEIKEILDKLDYIISRTEDDNLVNDYGIEIEDYITNLQEENERLKELCDKYEEEHSTTFEYWKRLVKEDYKSRIEKAINYIKVQQKIFLDYDIVSENQLKNLLEILQGVGKDE